MARVNSDSYEFLKNLPSQNPLNFSAMDRDKGAINQRTTFVRVIDVEETDDERKITNDKTSLLMRSLKKHWNFMTAHPIQNSRPSSSMQSTSTAASGEDRPSTSTRRTADLNFEDESVPATKHRRQS